MRAFDGRKGYFSASHKLMILREHLENQVSIGALRVADPSKGPAPE